MHFGHRLKAARTRKGLSLRQLSALTGVDRALIWRMEQREQPQESIRILMNLARALGVTLDDLAEMDEGRE